MSKDTSDSGNQQSGDSDSRPVEHVPEQSGDGSGEQGQAGSDPRLTARPLWTVRGNKATVPKTGSTSTDKGQDAGGKGRDD